MNKFFGHLNTINKHKLEVQRLCFKCGIAKQGLLHDLSKYSPTEFIPSVRYWTGEHSPIRDEVIEKGYSETWLHHKGRNKHHAEYWIDETHDLICDIPFNYIAEMFCDRVAACKTYQKEKYTTSSPLDYALNKMDHDKKMMTENSLNSLLHLLYYLKDNGEEQTCKYIKGKIKEEKKKK